MNAVMASSLTWARPSFNISGTPYDNGTGRVSLADAGVAASALAGAELESCASNTGTIWLHNPMTATAINGLQEIRLFIAIISGRLSGPSTASTPLGGHRVPPGASTGGLVAQMSDSACGKAGRTRYAVNVIAPSGPVWFLRRLRRLRYYGTCWMNDRLPAYGCSPGSSAGVGGYHTTLVTLLGIVTLVRRAQKEKACAPMLVTLAGIVMLVRLVQS